MRKSIKSLVALACAATMTLAMGLTAFAEDETPAPVDYASIPDGEAVYTMGSALSPVAWNPLAADNTLTETKWPGVYSIDITVPAYDEASPWGFRFGIMKYTNEFDNDLDATGWAQKVLLGTDFVGDNQSLVRLVVDAETKCTVYFDSKTSAVLVQDSEGNTIEPLISWVGFDDSGVYMTPAEYADITLDDYKELNSGEIGKLTYAATELPNFVKLEADLADKISKEPETEAETTTAAAEETTTAAAEETTTVAAATETTTVAAATATTTTAAATATTAKNQATKTGDVAPVALMVTLFAAVAVVAVVAKKKEA